MMHDLADLVQLLDAPRVIGLLPARIEAIESDSRRVGPGALYVALRGERRDGHHFARAAVASGAVAVVVETEVMVNAPQIVVADTRSAVSRLADAFYDRPSAALQIAGVTGTNGKTTTVHLLGAILNAARRPCAVVGTLGADFGAQHRPLNNTTPLALELHGLLAQLRDAGAAAVAMEVSSHALALGRVEDVRFAVGIFTNLSRDHLDFHATFEAYAQAKRRLLALAPRVAINVDDAAGARFAAEFPGAVTFALDAPAQVRAERLVLAPGGSRFTVDGTAVELPLRGRFNVYNALAAFAGARALGVDDATIARALATVRAVPGRMERIAAGGIEVIVDYAHTPDALANVLHAARESAHGRLTVVFGAGGDRDPGKRPQMGEIAARIADRVIVTSDNPRSEDPLVIARAIAGGTEAEIVLDRRTAIAAAIAAAAPGDTVVDRGQRPRDVSDRRRSQPAVRRSRRSPGGVRRARSAVRGGRMKLDIAAAIAALRPQVLGAAALPAEFAVGTDTRRVDRGAAFLALRGERFDGHAFIGEAFTRGAALAIVDDPATVPAGRPALVVADTLRAYLALAQLARTRVCGPVIAVSGSAGKTTTKSYVAQILAAAGVAVTATPENENNEIGVSKFLLGLEVNDPRVAVIEMGARKYGDLDLLVAAARPDIAVLTNIGEAHLEIMGSRRRLADTKWGLFRGGAQAVLNLADADSRERAAALTTPPMWFGVGADEPPAGAAAVIVRDVRTLAVYAGGVCTEIAVAVGVPGEHNRRNLAAALAAASVAGFPPARLAPYVGLLAQPAQRYETIALADGKRLIFDAYNASMSGTLATLDAFAQESAERRIAVLGSMAELGADAAQMHRRVGAAAAGASEFILAGGDYAADIVRGATDAGAAASRILAYAENAAAVAWLRANARAGDAILLKGSRKYRMEEIADALRANGTP